MQMQIQIDANPADTAVSEVSMMIIMLKIMMMMMMIIMIIMIMMIMMMIKVVAMTIIASKEVVLALFIAQVTAPSLLHSHDNINRTINDALMIKS